MAVEFSLPAGGSETGTNGHLGGARGRGRKAGAARDQLVEMRFYIPGTATKKVKDEEGDEKSADGEEEEEQNAANLFYDTLMDKAEIGEVAGDTFATFLDVLHLTPRSVATLLVYWTQKINVCAEDVSMSTCMRVPFDCAAKHTTTRSNTRRSKSSCFCRNRTTSIPSLLLALIHRFAKGRPDTLSL